MKLYLLVVLGVLICWVSSHGAETSIGERGPHHRIVRTADSIRLPSGRLIDRSTSYKEIAVGMHYRHNGEWVESREELELFQGGAIARQGLCQVIFSPNIATAGAIDILTPDGL